MYYNPAFNRNKDKSPVLKISGSGTIRAVKAPTRWTPKRGWSGNQYPFDSPYALFDEMSVSTDYDGMGLEMLAPSYLSATPVPVSYSPETTKPVTNSSLFAPVPVETSVQSPSSSGINWGGWLGNLIAPVAKVATGILTTKVQANAAIAQQQAMVSAYGTPLTNQAIMATANRDAYLNAQTGTVGISAGTIGIVALVGLGLVMLSKR